MPFAPVHFTTGPTVPFFGTTINTLYPLGYAEDGVSINVQPQFDEIYSDDFGGRGGAPSDAQLLGGRASLDMMLTKYQKSLADNLSTYYAVNVNTSNKGIFPVIGSFIRQDGLAGVLQLVGVNETMTFLTAFLKRNYEINSGTRYRRYACGFECWVNQTDYTQITVAQTRRLYTQV